MTETRTPTDTYYGFPVLQAPAKIGELTPKTIDEVILGAHVARVENCDPEIQPELAAFRVPCEDCYARYNCQFTDELQAAGLLNRGGYLSRRRYRRYVKRRRGK